MHRHLLHTKEVIRVYRSRNIYRLTSSHSIHWRLAQGLSFVAVIWQILRGHNGRLRRRYPTTGFFFPFIPLRSHRTHGWPAPCLNDSRVHSVPGRPVRLHRALSFLVSGAAWGSVGRVTEARQTEASVQRVSLLRSYPHGFLSFISCPQAHILEHFRLTQIW